MDGLPQEVPHGRRVIVEAPLTIAEDLDARRADEGGGDDLAGVIEVEDAEAAHQARVNADGAPHLRGAFRRAIEVTFRPFNQ